MSYFYYRYNVLTYNNNNINNRFKHSYIINRTLEIWRIKEEGRNKKKTKWKQKQNKIINIKNFNSQVHYSFSFFLSNISNSQQ